MKDGNIVDRVGDKLKALRCKCKISQKGLSKVVHVLRSIISKIERGEQIVIMNKTLCFKIILGSM